jgi:predicted ArsR family transcriptional regulator
MHTQLNCETVYTLTHSELVEAFAKWQVQAVEENWPDASGPVEEVAAANANVLVEFLNQQ